MENNESENKMMPLIPCFRPDGSFDFKLFITSPQVVFGGIFIIAGILASFLFTYVWPIESNFIGMMVLMLCTFVSFSGAETIVKYVNTSREAVKKK